MTKDEAIVEFLKGLRIALSTASAYPKDHPYFVQSIDNFKAKLDEVFKFLNPLKIGVAPGSLLIDERRWDKGPLYAELSAALHLRKVKEITLSGLVSTGQLKDLLGAISLPVRELLKCGGVADMLTKDKCPHISVEELDYSELLYKGGTEEAKDLWAYILRKVAKETDEDKISEFAAAFPAVIAKFDISDLCSDQDLRQNILNFINYLKGREQDKFYLCLRALLGAVLRDRRTPSQEEVNSLREFFRGLSREEFAEILSQEIASAGAFSSLNFTVFSRIADEEVHKRLAPVLFERIKGKDFIRAGLELKRRINDFLSAPENTSIAPLYKHALLWMAQEPEEGQGLNFDREKLELNYRMLLLNMFVREKPGRGLEGIIESLINEYEGLKDEERRGFLPLIFEALDKRQGLDAQGSPAAALQLEDFAAMKAEEELFSGHCDEGGARAVSRLKKSSLGRAYYIDRIFKDGTFDHFAIAAFLRFFRTEMEDFYAGISGRGADIEFMVRLAEAVSSSGDPEASGILGWIFLSCAKSAKPEILKIMRSCPGRFDFQPMLPLLKTGDYLLKREILSLLAGDHEAALRAAETIFRDTGFFGMTNRAILENIRLARESGLKEAREKLLVLSRRFFFWNRAVRRAAIEALKVLE